MALFRTMTRVPDSMLDTLVFSIVTYGIFMCAVNPDPMVFLYFEDAHAKGKEPFSLDFCALRLKSGVVPFSESMPLQGGGFAGTFSLKDYEPCPMTELESKLLHAWCAEFVPRLCRRWRESVESPSSEMMQ